ncbi:hypothetical protein Hypma_007842 [Hypsizygus marmoreus]|uniref:SEC7 domain-containing protein n=1 Tax=Hypsizygus marmoreus TaxID=39966 RepID=A0A369JYH6_HYPMA|nr:hypothetical protein Hypma_007842 [Hypsizygus marmoreus]
MEQDQQPSRAEQRMLAVAKLKRAASLPRMKDGRRPPMHVEAVSEGEKAQVNDEPREESSSPPIAADEQVEAEVDVEADVEEAERPVSPGPTARSKRRSRSRSRSRGSKDLRGKMRGLQSPTPTSQVAGDSSPDEAPNPPPLNLAGVTPLASPIPSNLLELQRSRLLRSPTPTSPDTPMNISPFPHSPVLLPTLEAWQRGLFRSNSAGGSAAGRMMAMHKLTGGTETYDPSTMSPASSPLPGKLSRNNTVTGGERTAARQFMLSRLGGRITKETDGEQVSGEERSAPSPTPKRRRRRSRRGSSSANAGISDSEFLSTSPSTPVVPPTPLPATFDALPDIRSRSATPYQLANPPNHEVGGLSDTQKSEEPIQEYERVEPTRRRSVVVEDDEEERYPPPKAYPVVSRHTPTQVTSLRLPHASDAPSNGSSDSAASPSAVSVPVYLSQRTPPGNDTFPRSPYVTPLKEVSDRDDEEEQVLYHADTYRPRTPYDESFEREISWIASPVPELDIRMPVDDDEENHEADQNEEDDQDLDEPPLSPRSSDGFTPEEHEAFDDTSPRVSSDSKSLVVESETSAVISPSYIPLSPSAAALSQTVSITRASDESMSPQTYPARLSVASRSPLNGEFADWDDRIPSAETNSKRNGDTPSTWEKVKNTFSRAGSSSGRRSRSNSIITRERRDHTDSSISRESGASLTSAKTDKGDVASAFAQQQVQPSLMQTPSASASILSLAPHTPVRGGPSPIPPPTTADMSKYQNAKLFPFPGMKKLEEQRNRAKGLPSASASSPDIIMLSSSNEEDLPPLSANSYNNTPAPTPDITRERKLSHQASDTRLMSKYNPPSSAAATSHPEYFDVTPQPAPQNGGSLNLKLPMTLPGVKQWLSKNNKKIFSSSQSSSPSSPAPISPPIIETRPPPPPPAKFAPESIGRTESETLGTDWEEIGTTPTSSSGDMLGKRNTGPEAQVAEPDTSITNGPTQFRSELTDTEKTPKAKKVMPQMDLSDTPDVSYFDDSPSPSALPPRSDPLSSTTPDPRSSLSDYPAHSTSESSSTTSSQYSLGAAGHQGPVILEKLEEDLLRGPRGIWSTVDSPPRGLVLSSPVFQVVNTNTLKDRFLFLFTDILVIAKPVISDQDTFIDSPKPNPLDRKFIVKSVAMLNQLQFKADRTESHGISNQAMTSRNPVMRSFIHNFSRDPDSAIGSLFAKSSKADDAGIVGQVLFNTLELDRSRLGEYLARRTSKAFLKSYLDSFGFLGLRVDKALRVFLLSIGTPRTFHHSNGLEYLLDAFAGRWYEANARIVDYDKDLAHRLVRAIVQLNELLHDGVAQEPGRTGYPLREVTSRDFVEAFRRYDQRILVSDELLEDVYESILKERLSQASSARSSVDSSIVIKRAIPPRLTWKVQSEPIVLRIPHADPDLTIQLYGHDLVFDPPFLNFAKSPEASFRVTGLSLGPKSMIMCRSGPNALKYGGLPLSSPVVVERAFMRHTFQLAFLNHVGVKRRYMFSVDDFLLRHQWVLSLKRQVDKAAEISTSSPSKFNRAAEIMSFRVLQETLIGSSPPPANMMRSALQRLNGGPQNHTTSPRSPHERTVPVANTNGYQFPPLHVRSKSRSKVYHRHGAGMHETDLTHSPNYRGSRDEGDGKADTAVKHDSDQPLRHEGPLWSAQDIEVRCKQNSAISPILLQLQVNTTEQGGS